MSSGCGEKAELMFWIDKKTGTEVDTSQLFQNTVLLKDWLGGLSSFGGGHERCCI